MAKYRSKNHGSSSLGTIMTTARAAKVDLDSTPYYHCHSRCVRRTFLCGFDKDSGRDYSHRRRWILKRIKYLARVFAIDMLAFAIMSNHYHLVIYINQQKAQSWSAEEVIRRWAKLYPRDAAKYMPLDVESETGKQKIAQWRERLMNISWYMSAINQKIARMANKEDDCKGHFWESRFSSQALLDEGAILSAMAYVDLNPVRAQEVQSPENAEFTSIYERIRAFKTSTALPLDEAAINQAPQPESLMPFAAQDKDKNKNEDEDEDEDEETAPASIDFSLADYLELVDTTGRIIREDKKGAIPEHLAPILARLNLCPSGWLLMVKTLEETFSSCVGNPDDMAAFRAEYHQWHKGIHAARHCYLHAA